MGRLWVNWRSEIKWDFSIIYLVKRKMIGALYLQRNIKRMKIKKI